jgi:hypothetical protein
MSLECAHLGLVAGTLAHIRPILENRFFLPPNSCSVFVSDMYGMRVPIYTPILCVMTPSLSLPCSAKRRRAGGRGSKTGVRWPDMGVECAVQGECRGCGAARHSSLTHPEAAGGCRVREGGRIGSTKAVMGQVLGGGNHITRLTRFAC